MSSIADTNSRLILLPACGMAMWTSGVLGLLAFKRFTAISEKRVNIEYYKLYDTNEEPKDIAIVAQHLENLFEAPPMFYAAVLGLAVTKTATTLSVRLAWAYLVSRMLHSFVHLGSNNILWRFRTFIASTVALVTLWGQLTYKLVQA